MTIKTIGFVAHDEKKSELVGWVEKNQAKLEQLSILSTGTTGGLIQEKCPQLSIQRLKSGPLGGDQQLGAAICEDRLDAMVFFIDPLSPHPHDVDVKALLRLAILYNVPFACNLASADALLNLL
ncbi:methylglyoxal synthase [Sessilibacter corallicola]|uniref:Methylglyoxal synthase n=1 Tax=Sessilibacter corallicola TaxID=2904075 RepID=A0ABQ0ACJ7_9GAMM